MTDSSTWVASKKDLDKLTVLFRGDPMLVNVYHGLCRPKDGSPEQEHAEQFLWFLGTDKAQQVLRSFGVDRYGESMYHDAEYATRFDH